ncbi:hypothetical protein HELRODRAFT_180363 [Helobdella robusta]|uniref:Uncharacterized protein n=1 Tax=Helobdella robusta TaxID=6412 RepID=T1FFU1_HELRO|nr:hypothetical protein HELRODRAFT_180363 [Helobdella robusta]ESN93954.1 hypothetical protein HELRODRAFT_180363 [Helobdella robusta]
MTSPTDKGDPWRSCILRPMDEPITGKPPLSCFNNQPVLMLECLRGPWKDVGQYSLVSAESQMLPKSTNMGVTIGTPAPIFFRVTDFKIPGETYWSAVCDESIGNMRLRCLTNMLSKHVEI